MRHAIAPIRFASLGLGLAISALGMTAVGQEQPYLKQSLTAPSNAFELQLSTGYTQGFGSIIPNAAINDVAGAGIGFTAAVAYRMNPWLSLDFEGQYQVFVAQNSNSSQGVNTNIGVTAHMLPSSRVDPWIRLGSGWRWIWQNDVSSPFGGPLVAVNASNTYQGWDIINARIGVDIRTSENVSWAPVIGADVQTFFWVNTTALSAAQVGTFVYAGVQGRFDFGPSGPTKVAVARPY